MKHMGHVENGMIVLDEPTVLKEGMRVQVEFVELPRDAGAERTLRGTAYSLDDPFAPAAEPDEWDCIR